jgi:hypothetical protein
MKLNTKQNTEIISNKKKEKNALEKQNIMEDLSEVKK